MLRDTGYRVRCLVYRSGFSPGDNITWALHIPNQNQWGLALATSTIRILTRWQKGDLKKWQQVEPGDGEELMGNSYARLEFC